MILKMIFSYFFLKYKMNKLYELNKDMLVNLVETISRDLRKELEQCKRELKEYNDKIDMIYETTDEIFVQKCSAYHCGALWCSNDRTKNVYKYCNTMTFCNECGNSFCDAHIDIESDICYECIKK